MSSRRQIVVCGILSLLVHVFILLFCFFSMQHQNIYTPIVVLGLESRDTLPSFYKSMPQQEVRPLIAPNRASQDAHAPEVLATPKKEGEKRVSESIVPKSASIVPKEEKLQPSSPVCAQKKEHVSASMLEKMPAIKSLQEQDQDLKIKEKKIEKVKKIEEKKLDAPPHAMHHEDTALQETALRDQAQDWHKEDLSQKISSKKILPRRRSVAHDELALYQAYVQQEIRRVWRPPAGVPKGTECQVFFSLDVSGVVKDARIVKPSSHVLYNLSIQKIIRNCHFDMTLGGKSFTVTFRQ